MRSQHRRCAQHARPPVHRPVKGYLRAVLKGGLGDRGGSIVRVGCFSAVELREGVRLKHAALQVAERASHTSTIDSGYQNFGCSAVEASAAVFLGMQDEQGIESFSTLKCSKCKTRGRHIKHFLCVA